MVLGELPKMSERLTSIGFSPVVFDSKVKRSSLVTSPTSYIGERSLSAILPNKAASSFPMTRPIRSCDSLPIISLADRVGSPIGNLSKSILPPVSSTNSERQLRCPPAP